MKPDCVDVLVVGGGTAGVTAALAAARNGMRTCLVERFGALGGATTVGLVTTWGSQYVDAAGKSLIGGIANELLEWLVVNGHTKYATLDEARRSFPLIYCAHQPLAAYLTRLLRAAGVEILLHTSLAGVVVEGERLSGVRVADVAGQRVIEARQVIDATGEALVAEASGAPCTPHPTGTMGLMYVIGGVDFDAYFDWLENVPAGTGCDTKAWIKQHVGVDLDERPWERWRLFVADASGRVHADFGGALGNDAGSAPVTPQRQRAAYEAADDFFPLVFPPPQLRAPLMASMETGGFPLFRRFGDGDSYVMWDFGNRCANFGRKGARTLSLNMCRVVQVDATSSAARTLAEQTAKEYAHGQAEYLRRHVPGFADSSIAEMGGWVMPRLSRQIEAEYAVTRDDVDAGRQFPDTITLAGGMGTPNTGGVPYRIMLPKDVEDLLVAGKGAAIANTAMRHVPIAQSMGEAAGTAAAICVEKDISPRQLLARIGELQDRLRAAGVVLD